MVKSLSFTDIEKSCPSREYLVSQIICLFALFAKIKFSRKFPDLQYWYLSHCRAMEIQTVLDKCTDSPELSLLAYTKYRCIWRLRPKFGAFVPLDGRVCTIKNRTTANKHTIFSWRGINYTLWHLNALMGWETIHIGRWAITPLF